MKILALLLLLIPLAGCKAGQGDRCAKSEDCGTGLVCFAPTEAQGSFIKARSYADLEPYLDAYTCVTPEDLAEAAQAFADARCRARVLCKDFGRCTEKDGSCIATRDADCRASTIDCKDDGKCTAHRDGWCRATSNADCRATERCKRWGRCTAKDGKCRATSDADCRATEKCKRWGRCTAKDGDCVE